MSNGQCASELIKQFESQTKFYQSMHLHFGKTTMRDMDQQTKKNGLKQVESSLGMFLSLMISLVATMLPTPSIGTTSTMMPTIVSTLEEHSDDYLIRLAAYRLGDT